MNSQDPPTETGTVDPISVEDDQHAIDEIDSAFGDSDNESAYSTSVASSIYRHVYENGRRYHSFREGTYMIPDDEDEQDRLDLHHHIWLQLVGGRLYTAPLKEPQRILDVGTGTGIWAVEMADEFPAAIVHGTDISPIQPEWVPPNCQFYIDDVESVWVFKQPFDYIHGRALGGVISDWKKFQAEAFKHLKPGGWLEMQDFEGFVFSDDGTLSDDSWIVQWTSEMDRGSQQFGKRFDAIVSQKQNMIDAGFVNIKSQIFKLPIGPWAKDKKMKELGKYVEIMMNKAVDSYTPAMYTRVLGHSMTETQILMEHVKQEMSNRKIHKYAKYHFLCGQKPEA